MVFLNLGQAYFSVDSPKDFWICFSCGLNNEHIVVQSSNMKYTLVRLGVGLARLGMFLIEIIYSSRKNPRTKISPLSLSWIRRLKILWLGDLTVVSQQATGQGQD